MLWASKVLVVTNPFHAEWSEAFLQTLSQLQSYQLQLFWEEHPLKSLIEAEDEEEEICVVLENIKVLTEENKHEIEAIVTLGGDGTLLHAVRLYYS